MPYFLNGCGLEILLRLDDFKHLPIEVAQPMVAQVFIVNQIPLATGILVRPAITLTREVNPFRMSELITHEVQIAAIDGTSRHEANHLMQGNTALCNVVDILLGKVPVHVGIYQSEDDGLVAYKCLVVALAV